MGNFNPGLKFLRSILLGLHDKSGKDYTSFPLSADSAPRAFRKATVVVKR